MRGSWPGMHVRVDEAWAHEFALGIDGAVDAAFESLSDVEDPVVLEDDLAVAQERVMTALMAHHPRRLDLAAHVFSPRAELATLERIRVNWNQCEPRTRSYPPPCGEGGERSEPGGGRSCCGAVSTNCDPHPQPLPTRGRGVDRVCRSRICSQASCRSRIYPTSAACGEGMMWRGPSRMRQSVAAFPDSAPFFNTLIARSFLRAPRLRPSARDLS